MNWVNPDDNVCDRVCTKCLILKKQLLCMFSYHKQTLKYLSKTPCAHQSPEIIKDFLSEMLPHKLTKWVQWLMSFTPHVISLNIMSCNIPHIFQTAPLHDFSASKQQITEWFVCPLLMSFLISVMWCSSPTIHACILWVSYEY